MMNNGVPLDVLKIVERLEGGGVPHDQAKVQATVLAEVIGDERRRMDARYLPRDELAHALLPISTSIDRLDAKVDRHAAESRARDDRLELKIEKSASDVKNDILRWALSLWFFQTGLLAALIFRLHA
jgi:hypothetical protein